MNHKENLEYDKKYETFLKEIKIYINELKISERTLISDLGEIIIEICSKQENPHWAFDQIISLLNIRAKKALNYERN